MGYMSSNSILVKRILKRLETIENELKSINRKLESKQS